MLSQPWFWVVEARRLVDLLTRHKSLETKPHHSQLVQACSLRGTRTSLRCSLWRRELKELHRPWCQSRLFPTAWTLAWDPKGWGIKIIISKHRAVFQNGLYHKTCISWDLFGGPISDKAIHMIYGQSIESFIDVVMFVPRSWSIMKQVRRQLWKLETPPACYLKSIVVLICRSLSRPCCGPASSTHIDHMYLELKCKQYESDQSFLPFFPLILHLGMG